ncbi:MAG: FecR domain-containing protein [Terriglobia bacterium]
MNLDQLLGQIRNTEPNAGEVEAAKERVKARLFPKAEGVTGPATGATIRSCADFRVLTPAYLAGTLDTGRKLLFEVHTRECVACRKALENVRFGARAPLPFTPRKSNHHYAGWAIAASALLAAGGVGYWGMNQYPALAGGPRATVDAIDGALYKVTGANLTPVAPGAELAENDVVRTAKNSTAVLHLNDGSSVEMGQRASISVTRTFTGSTIHLGLGRIIVQAAKQRKGSLQVATADCKVSVKGTVFAVDAGTRGSRVAVVEGTVWVDHGEKHDVLHRGDATSTDPDMTAKPIREEFEWSRNSAEYMSLLGEFSGIGRAIEAIPAQDLRYESRLLAWLPADIGAIAAIPNVGGTIAQANAIFHSRLQQSQVLTDWWNHISPAQRSTFEATVLQLQTAGSYIGNEIVIAAPGTGKSSPLILAQLVKPGLEAFLRSQLPASSIDGHMRFDNGLFAAAAESADLNRLSPSGAFLQTALYRKLAPLYQQGAGWLFAADLQVMSPNSQVAGTRFLIAQSRTVAGVTENRASVTFSKDREGVASWLSAPGPMGSLDFISPDAGFAVSMLLKSPARIVDDITKMMPVPDSGSAVAHESEALKAEMASAFGGEVTVALDGPLFPVPSWKIAAEVYYPDRLQSAIAKFVTMVNGSGNREATGELKLTEADSDGRQFYTLKFDKLPWEAQWTFIDGYWLVAANHELLVRSIQNRQTGFSLAKSNAFRAQLPRDATLNFSAVVYHNLGPALKMLNISDTPGVVCFWAAPDQIDIATVGNLATLNFQALLGMQNAGPLQMLKLGQAH